MDYSFEQLKKMTVAQLREIAKGLESEEVKGYTQLNKEHLLMALCRALKIDIHPHKKSAAASKGKVKKIIRALKKKRDEALKIKDYQKYRFVLDHLRVLKRRSRRQIF